MDIEYFLNSCRFIRDHLVGMEMDRTFNSIGSHVFFDFGKENEFLLRNGRKYIQKDWCIWVGAASWRISHKGKHIVGSWDPSEIIGSKILSLLGKKFQSFQFLSQFLDAEFNFEDGYQITTFFNWSDEGQWSIFMPNVEPISIDCSNQDELKDLQNLSEKLELIDTYKPLAFPIQSAIVIDVNLDEYNQPILSLNNDLTVHLKNCAWRFEKEGGYISGSIDIGDLEDKTFFKQLIGKKITHLDLANSMMDARFCFEGEYVLKTFSCSNRLNQWMIKKGNKTLFNAKIKPDE